MLKPENIFDLAYARNPAISWRQDEEGLVELTVENKGFFNRLAQKVFNRPAISYIQLDAIGSLVWLQLGQKDDVLSISEAVKEKFGQEAEPLLQRLGQFFNIMEQHQLIIRK